MTVRKPGEEAGQIKSIFLVDDKLLRVQWKSLGSQEAVYLDVCRVLLPINVLAT